MLRQHNARYHATRLQAPYQPVVERALIPFTCAIWLATALQILHAHGIPGWSLLRPIATPDAFSLLLQDGALYGPYVFAGGEVWRLLTSLFLHGPLLHVASTMLFLYILGVDLERFVGHLRWGAIYLGSGVLAGLFSAVVLHPPVIEVGASAAVAGIVGAYGLSILRYPYAYPSRAGSVFLWCSSS